MDHARPLPEECQRQGAGHTALGRRRPRRLPSRRSRRGRTSHGGGGCLGRGVDNIVLPTAAAKVFGVEPRSDEAKARFSTLVHWGYGTGWGAVRGLLGAVALRGPLAAFAHLAVVWGTELTMLPALEVAPPVREWGAKELAIDLFPHGVYALATSLAYNLLARE